MVAPSLHTSQIEATFGPVSLNIAQVIAVNEQAAAKGVPSPDFYPGCEAVNVAVKNMAAIGTKWGERPDNAAYARDMNGLSADLERTGGRLVAAADALRKDPTNNDCREGLNKEARLVVKAFTAILELHDRVEVVNISKGAKNVKELAGKFSNISDMGGMLSLAREIQSSSVSLAKNVFRRETDLINGSHSLALAQQNDIVRQATPALLKAGKLLASHPGDAAIKKAVNGISKQLGNACDKIQTLVAMRIFKEDINEDMVRRTMDMYDKELTGFPGAVLAGKRLQSLDALRKMLNAVKEAAMKVAKKTDSVDLRNSIMEKIKVLGNLHAELEQVSGLYEKDPTNKEHRKKLDDTIAKLKSEISELSKLLRKELANLSVEAFNQADGIAHSEVLGKGCVSKTPGEFSDAFEKWSTFGKDLENLAGIAIDLAPTEEQRNLIKGKSEGVQNLVPSMALAANMLHRNPDDEDLQSNMKENIELWNTKVNELKESIDGVLEGKEIVEAIKTSIERDIELLKGAVKTGAKEQASKFDDRIKAKLDLVSQFARKEMDNSDDSEFKTKVEESVKELNAAKVSQSKNSQMAVAECKNTGFYDLFDKSCDRLIEAVEKVKYAVCGEELPDVASLDVEDEALEPPEDEAVPEDPLAAAAFDLKQETNKWHDKDNSLVSIAMELAELLKEMSVYAQDPSQKTKLIATGKLITNKAVEIVKDVEVIAKHCSDKRLKVQLLTLQERIPSIGQQLKIIAGVKAASPADSGTDEQLIVCAQNLVSSVKNVVGGCEAACIKLMPTAPESIKAIRWKKKVYRAR
eukprot:Nk52_evm20s2474 gene=Nk52_evmTU20s2474